MGLSRKKCSLIVKFLGTCAGQLVNVTCILKTSYHPLNEEKKTNMKNSIKINEERKKINGY
jgi:hypothetical protein